MVKNDYDYDDDYDDDQIVRGARVPGHEVPCQINKKKVTYFEKTLTVKYKVKITV